MNAADAEVSRRSRGHWLAPSMVLVILITAGAWTLVTLAPPTDVAPDSGFDTERAIEHLTFIARDPRPLGSRHHRAVREHLVKEFESLGLLVETQSARVPLRRDGSGPRIEIINVMARLPGTSGASGRAIMLAGHYDSTHTNAAASRGAGDDGAAVAALLEVARVLSGNRPACDVIFLITDGEERGLLGARAFVDEHWWFHDVAYVFNFEARGTSGPSLMFQTSPRSGWLVDQYARVAPHPRTSSIGHEIYRLMPNDTDFTIFRNAGLAGLNFAFIGDYHNYHRAGDAIENLSLASLRHHGVQALALARHFANLDLSAKPRSYESIYFNAGSLGVVRYRQSRSLPLAGLAVIASLGATVAVRPRRIATLTGIIGAAGVLVLNIAVVALIAWGVTWFVPLAKLDRNEDLSVAGFSLLALVGTCLTMWTFRRRAGAMDQAVIALLVWTILSVASAALVPAASYLLVWPALFGAVGMMLTTSNRKVSVLGALVSTLPLVVLLTPIVYLAFLGLRIRMAPAVVVVIVLALWMVLPRVVWLARACPHLPAGAQRSAAPDPVRHAETSP